MLKLYRKYESNFIGLFLFSILPFTMAYILWLPILIKINIRIAYYPIPFIIVWSVFVFKMFNNTDNKPYKDVRK